MANYNYVTTDDIIDAYDAVVDNGDTVTIKSSRGNVCKLRPLYNCDNELIYISVDGDGCSFDGCYSNSLGEITFSVLLALHAHLKVNGYGYLRCDSSFKPNTIWYSHYKKQLVIFDKYGDYYTLCED